MNERDHGDLFPREIWLEAVSHRELLDRFGKPRDEALHSLSSSFVELEMIAPDEVAVAAERMQSAVLGYRSAGNEEVWNQAYDEYGTCRMNFVGQVRNELRGSA